MHAVCESLLKERCSTLSPPRVPLRMDLSAEPQYPCLTEGSIKPLLKLKPLTAYIQHILTPSPCIAHVSISQQPLYTIMTSSQFLIDLFCILPCGQQLWPDSYPCLIIIKENLPGKHFLSSRKIAVFLFTWTQMQASDRCHKVFLVLYVLTQVGFEPGHSGSGIGQH